MSNVQWEGNDNDINVISREDYVYTRIDTKILYPVLILSLLSDTVVVFPEFRGNDFPLLPLACGEG